MPLRLRINNPYSSGTLMGFPDGSLALDRNKVNYVKSERDKLRVVTKQDTLDGLAFMYYGDSKFWWLIADVNKIDNPLSVPDDYVGKVLVIPDLIMYKALVL